MKRISKWGVALVCGTMLIGLLPAASEGGLFGRRCGSHGGWRGWGSHGSYGSFGGWRGSRGGYASHGSYGSHGGYVNNGCGSHGGYSRGVIYEEGEPVPHESQYRGDYDRQSQTYRERDWRYREDAERQASRDERRATDQQQFRDGEQGRAPSETFDQGPAEAPAPELTPPEPPAPSETQSTPDVIENNLGVPPIPNGAPNNQ